MTDDTAAQAHAETVDAVRDRLVEAALDHITFDGWSLKALRQAAHDCGLDHDAPERAFPHGVIGAVEHFIALADRRMLEDAAAAAAEMQGLGLTARVEHLVRLRLERWGPHQEAVRRALAVLALPQNSGVAAKATWTTCDLIWKLAGDRSNDFNWYTKRGALTAVYSATVLYWLDDQSDGFEATWDFLHRRLGDVVQMLTARRRLTEQVQRSLDRLPNPFRLFGGGRPGTGPRRRPGAAGPGAAGS